jgi:hypothetical protein
MRPLAEEHANVTRSVQNANDLNTFRNGAIKDDLITDGKTAEPGCKVWPSSTEFWHACQHCAFLADYINPATRGRWIFFGDAQRDFGNIKVGPAGSQNSGHQAPFLFSRFRTFSLIAGISNGASSPRSACSIPTAISRRSSSWRRCRTSSDSPSQRYSSHRSCVERRFVADLTSATVLMRGEDNTRTNAFQFQKVQVGERTRIGTTLIRVNRKLNDPGMASAT